MKLLAVYVSDPHFELLEAMRLARDGSRMSAAHFARQILESALAEYQRQKLSEQRKSPAVAPSPKPKAIPMPYASLRRRLGDTLAQIRRFENKRRKPKIQSQIRYGRAVE